MGFRGGFPVGFQVGFVPQLPTDAVPGVALGDSAGVFLPSGRAAASAPPCAEVLCAPADPWRPNRAFRPVSRSAPCRSRAAPLRCGRTGTSSSVPAPARHPSIGSRSGKCRSRSGGRRRGCGRVHRHPAGSGVRQGRNAVQPVPGCSRQHAESESVTGGESVGGGQFRFKRVEPLGERRQGFNGFGVSRPVAGASGGIPRQPCGRTA